MTINYSLLLYYYLIPMTTTQFIKSLETVYVYSDPFIYMLKVDENGETVETNELFNLNNEDEAEEYKEHFYTNMIECLWIEVQDGQNYETDENGNLQFIK